MTNLFKKAAVATDIHLGLKSNSVQHNIDCVDYIDWFIATAKKEKCDVCLFLGDWHNHRANISIQTLHYSMKCLEKLNNAFSKVYLITGNHDLFFREKRDVHSVAWADYLPNVTVVNEIFTDGNVTLCPWLVGDELKQMKSINSTYTFGHFELPYFLMNAQVMMPDTGHISIDDFQNTGTVFSGHFHKRQSKNNIWYIGNTFPHNYSDAGDDQRGMMILEWGKKPTFKSWPNQPIFRVFKLSDILENTETLLLPNSHIRVHIDVDISYEEASYIRETLIPEYKLREMSLIPMRTEQIAPDGTTAKFDSVDSIVLDQINAIDSKTYDKQILMDIYQNL